MNKWYNRYKGLIVGLEVIDHILEGRITRKLKAFNKKMENDILVRKFSEELAGM